MAIVDVKVPQLSESVAEATLLQVAHSYEVVTDWLRRAPVFP